MSDRMQSRREFISLTAAGIGAGLAGGVAAGPTREFASQDQRRDVGFAVAGVGTLTETQLLPALREAQNCRPVGLITSNPERVLPLAAEYGIPAESVYSYDDMARIARNPDIEAVHVATPNSLHREHTVAAARAGKHVFCEKPMATSVSECEEMIAACESSGVKLAIGYRLQFEAHHLECMRLAREKEFGDLKMVQASFGFRLGNPNQWRLKRALAGGGALIDAGIYAIQACRYLSGEEPIEVVAFSTTTDSSRFAEVEESLGWQMRFPSGCLAVCSSTYNARAMDRFKAYAEQGWFGLEPAFRYRELVGRRFDGGPLRFPHINHFVRELEDFAQCIIEDRQSKVDGAEGLRDMRVIEAVYESVRVGRSVTLT